MTHEPIHVDPPPVYCPIAPAVHPLVSEIQHRSEDWIAQFAFWPDATGRERVQAFNCGELAARMAPHGIPEHLQICTDWFHLAFVWDEFYDRLPTAKAGGGLAQLAELAVKVIRTLRVPGAALLSDSSPSCVALRDLAERLHGMSTPVQRHRIIDGQQDWLSAVAWEVASQTRTELPSLADYTAQRLYTVGGTAFTGWLDFLNGIEVSGKEWDAPAVRALTEISGIIVAVDNDLYSYAKDLWFQQRHGVLLLNYVSVLAAHSGCSAPEALDHAVRMRDRLMCLFLILREQIARRASSDLNRYIVGLGHFIRANIDYGNVSLRYRNPDGRSPNATQSTMRFSDAPSDASLEPIDVPHIAWWWEQLDG
jgi:hypothetical protein